MNYEEFEKNLMEMLLAGDDEVTKKIGIAIASENILKKDWMKPEEEKAWKNL